MQRPTDRGSSGRDKVFDGWERAAGSAAPWSGAVAFQCKRDRRAHGESVGQASGGVHDPVESDRSRAEAAAEPAPDAVVGTEQFVRVAESLRSDAGHLTSIELNSDDAPSSPDSAEPMAGRRLTYLNSSRRPNTAATR